MAFIDALQDTVTIYTVSTGYKSGDTVGEQVKTETPLYQNVKGRLNSLSNSALSIRRNFEGQHEKFDYSWILEMAPEYNGANRGDKVVCNGQNYIISKKHEIRGTSSAIHHVVYYLEEAL